VAQEGEDVRHLHRLAVYDTLLQRQMAEGAEEAEDDLDVLSDAVRLLARIPLRTEGEVHLQRAQVPQAVELKAKAGAVVGQAEVAPVRAQEAVLPPHLIVVSEEAVALDDAHRSAVQAGRGDGEVTEAQKTRSIAVRPSVAQQLMEATADGSQTVQVLDRRHTLTDGRQKVGGELIPCGWRERWGERGRRRGPLTEGGVEDGEDGLNGCLPHLVRRLPRLSAPTWGHAALGALEQPRVAAEGEDDGFGRGGEAVAERVALLHLVLPLHFPYRLSVHPPGSLWQEGET
jgi:hypothetical protein